MKPYRLEFELEGLPPTANGSHGHWHKAAGIRKDWRRRSKLRCFMQRPPKPLTAVKLTLIRFSSGLCDEDNLSISFKSVVDGLKDAGIIIDDKKTVVLVRECKQEKAPPGKGKIRVIVESLESAAATKGEETA